MNIYSIAKFGPVLETVGIHVPARNIRNLSVSFCSLEIGRYTFRNVCLHFSDINCLLVVDSIKFVQPLFLVLYCWLSVDLWAGDLARK
jgi:hypothetical protein